MGSYYLNGECSTTLESGSSFVAGVVVLASSMASLSVISSARIGKKRDGVLYLSEALNWISLMIAAVFMSYSALDFPRILHAWRASRCA